MIIVSKVDKNDEVQSFSENFDDITRASLSSK